jgi:hypothetical protein
MSFTDGMARKPKSGEEDKRRSTSARKSTSSGSRAAKKAASSSRRSKASEAAGRTSRGSKSGSIPRGSSGARTAVGNTSPGVPRSQITDAQIRSAERGARIATVANAITQVAAPRTKGEAIERLKAADDRIGGLISFEDLKAITRHAETAVGAIGEESSAGRSELTGEDLPSHEELARIRLLNLRHGFALRHQIINDTLSVQDVADLLNVGRQTPHDRVKAKTLLAIKDNGQWRFPTWQFDPTGPDGVIEGLPDVLRALRAPMSQLARISWFVTPKAQLDGRAPVEAMQAGDVDEVITAAYAVGAS